MAVALVETGILYPPEYGDPCCGVVVKPECVRLQYSLKYKQNFNYRSVRALIAYIWICSISVDLHSQGKDTSDRQNKDLPLSESFEAVNENKLEFRSTQISISLTYFLSRASKQPFTLRIYIYKQRY